MIEEEKKLYPFRLIPLEEGQESVQIADLGYQDSEIQNGYLAADTISEVMDMYMDRVVGEHVFAWYGRQFPILMKYIKATDALPLMVCPDDETAGQRWDFLGKKKFWYIVDAEPGAKLYLGFAKDVEPADFYMAVRHADVGGMLNAITPHKGEAYVIEPGTVHSASGGVLIAEVAESSPLDFRIFNWGREMEGDEFDSQLNLDAAFDFITYSAYKAPAEGHHHEMARVTRTLADCPEFKVTEVALMDALHIYSEKSGSFMFYSCLRGGALIKTAVDGIAMEYPIDFGQSILVPADVSDFILEPRERGALLLEVMLEKRAGVDSYTGEEEDGCCHDDGEEECHCHDDGDETEEECHCHGHHHGECHSHMS